jgi:hypothetical protein
MIKIVGVSVFDNPVTLEPGDTLKVIHKYQLVEDGPMHEAELSRQEIPVGVTWTHSILFELDGVLNHIIGDLGTLEWLEGQV